MKLMRLMIFAALASAAPAAAQAPDPLFAASDPVRLTIRAPLNSLIRNRAAPGAISGTLVDSSG